jgi:hypothetical protein
VSGEGSAYGAGAPSYRDAELQKLQLDGRLKVAMGIRDRAKAAGNQEQYESWAEVVDELLDRRLETRGQ